MFAGVADMNITGSVFMDNDESGLILTGYATGLIALESAMPVVENGGGLFDGNVVRANELRADYPVDDPAPEFGENDLED